MSFIAHRRVASNRNHVRRSDSSIQTSNRLAVATSSCSSQRPCVSRMCAASCLLIVAQVAEHIHRRNKIRIVVSDALQAANVADRAQGRAADLADTLSYCIGSGEDLAALLVQQMLIVAKMRTLHMPMKILRLHIQRNISASRIFSAPERSRTPFGFRHLACEGERGQPWHLEFELAFYLHLRSQARSDARLRLIPPEHLDADGRFAQECRLRVRPHSKRLFRHSERDLEGVVPPRKPPAAARAVGSSIGLPAQCVSDGSARADEPQKISHGIAYCRIARHRSGI
jgi:hypothetical protein